MTLPAAIAHIDPTCLKCHAEIPPDDQIYVGGKDKTWLRKRCRSCRNEEARQRNAKDPNLPNRQRKARLSRCYGLSLFDYDKLLARQDFKCAVCKLHHTQNTHGTLYVDHDHTTGTVRGLLCQKCNVGIGNFLDSADLCRAAGDYLDSAS